MVLEDFTMSEPKTKLAASIFDNLDAHDYVLLVLPTEDENIVRSMNNLPFVEVIRVDHLNTYDVLSNDRVIFTLSSLDKLQGGVGDEGSS